MRSALFASDSIRLMARDFDFARNLFNACSASWMLSVPKCDVLPESQIWAGTELRVPKKWRHLWYTKSPFLHQPWAPTVWILVKFWFCSHECAVSIFLRIKTLRFHINALSATLDFALSFEPLNDTTDFPARKTSLAFQSSNVDAFPAPFDNGQDSCGYRQPYPRIKYIPRPYLFLKCFFQSLMSFEKSS